MQNLTITITMSPEQRYSWALHSDDARPGELSDFLARNPGWRPFPMWEWSSWDGLDSLVGDDYSGQIVSLHGLAPEPRVVRIRDEQMEKVTDLRVEQVTPLESFGCCSFQSSLPAAAVIDHARLFVNDGGDRLLVTQPYVFGALLEEGLTKLCAQECAAGLVWRIAPPTTAWYHPAASLAFVGRPEVVDGLDLGSLQELIADGALEVVEVGDAYVS